MAIDLLRQTIPHLFDVYLMRWRHGSREVYHSKSRVWSHVIGSRWRWANMRGDVVTLVSVKHILPATLKALKTFVGFCSNPQEIHDRDATTKYRYSCFIYYLLKLPEWIAHPFTSTRTWEHQSASGARTTSCTTQGGGQLQHTTANAYQAHCGVRCCCVGPATAAATIYPYCQPTATTIHGRAAVLARSVFYCPAESVLRNDKNKMKDRNTLPTITMNVEAYRPSAWATRVLWSPRQTDEFLLTRQFDAYILN